MGATDNRNQGLLPQLSDLNVQFLLISNSEMQSPNVIVTTIKMKLKTITCCSYEALNPVVSVFYFSLLIFFTILSSFSLGTFS